MPSSWWSGRAYTTKTPISHFPNTTTLQSKSTNLLTLHDGFAHKEWSILLLTPHGPLELLIHLLYGNSNSKAHLLWSKMPTLDLQWWWINPQDAMAISDTWIPWETMRAFYLKNKQWPLTDNLHSTRREDRSPLDWTMFQVLLTEVWLMTYAWHEPSATMVRPLCISNAMWNQW